MAKALSIITNGKKGGLPVQNAGLKLSKIIGIDKIELHDGFKNLYTIKPDRLERIEASMSEHGFEQNRPIDIWITNDTNGTEHFYLIDGHTRVTAAKAVGMTTVPYFEHHFENYNEALLYAIHTQIDRRNIDGVDFLNNIKFLMESDYIKEFKGSRNAEIARILGVSEKTVERGKYVIEHASDEQWEEIKNDNATVNSIHTKLKEADFFEKNATDEQKEAVESGEAEIKEINAEIKASQKEDEESDRQMSVQDADSEDANTDSDDSGIDDFDDISDALEDTSDDPKGLTISDHSDHIERPTNKLSAEEDSERTKERRKAYEMGVADGRKETLESLTENIKIKHFGAQIPVKSIRYDKTSDKYIIEADEKSQRVKLSGDQAVDFILNETVTAERLIRELSKLPPKATIKVANSSLTKEAIHFYFYPDYHYAVISDTCWPGMSSDEHSVKNNDDGFMPDIEFTGE